MINLGTLELSAISLLTSFITASMGIGGGTLLLAVMAQALPPAAIVPVHGVVQFGSNFGRTLLLLKYVNWRLFAIFASGALVGAWVGGNVVVSLPAETLKPILGAFILFSVWGPGLKQRSISKPGLCLGGVVTSIATMFVGATGPFVLALLRTFKLAPPNLVATNSLCLVLQHLLKAVVFGFLGFAFQPYIELIACMIAAGFIGTVLGKKVLMRVNTKHFETLLSVILTLLALRLIISSLEF